jgi:LAO/AO transport system kinase
MRAPGTAIDLAHGVLAGEVWAIARMITRVERGVLDGTHELAELYRAGGRARVIGITGPAGAGKSTLVAALGTEIRRRDLTLGIVAVDPTSPYSGGSVLGDRIRMQALWDDREVFIRSMATRGALGGITRATSDAIAVLDAAGKDVVLVETVGVGQDEVDIAQASHSVVVVSAPGLGDDVQALKAGLLETADVHVVNKADLVGADRTVAELRSMLHFGAGDGWAVPVVPTCAETGQGVIELADALNAHHDWLVDSGAMAERQRIMARHRLKTLLTALVHVRLDRPVPGSAFETAVEALCRRTTDPWSAAHSLLEEELSGRPKGRS